MSASAWAQGHFPASYFARPVLVRTILHIELLFANDPLVHRTRCGDFLHRQALLAVGLLCKISINTKALCSILRPHRAWHPQMHGSLQHAAWLPPVLLALFSGCLWCHTPCHPSGYRPREYNERCFPGPPRDERPLSSNHGAHPERRLPSEIGVLGSALRPFHPKTTRLFADCRPCYTGPHFSVAEQTFTGALLLSTHRLVLLCFHGAQQANS